MLSVDVMDIGLAEADVEILAIPAFASPDLPEDEKERHGQGPPPVLGPAADALGETLDTDLASELQALRFDGAVGSVARIPTRGATSAHTVLAVGLGKQDDVDLESLRKAGAALADATSRAASVATSVPAGVASLVDDEGLTATAATQAFVEGAVLASYRFTAYKSDDEGHDLERLVVVTAGVAEAGDLEDGAHTGRVYAEAGRLARDLVNEPPAGKRPPAFAERIRDDLDGSSVTVEIFDEVALADGGFGGVLAVGQGSSAPPRLVVLRYEPEDAGSHVTLVGKGITFDSGGLSLKPGGSMMTMKMDMGGAASVYAVVKAAAELDLPVRLTGVMAFAENMPSASAQRPGDVYTARNGKTVEVLNTDAEGRLVLSDALSYASEQEPDTIVEMSTLTGAVVVALGNRIGGVMSPDDDLVDALVGASDRSGERLWRLPLPDDYKQHLKSEVADLKNIGKSGVAGTIVAGLFLSEFVADGIPWAHLDIAGLAWSDEQYGYVRKGGTGAPVRTLLTWLASLPS